MSRFSDERNFKLISKKNLIPGRHLARWKRRARTWQLMSKFFCTYVLMLLRMLTRSANGKDATHFLFLRHKPASSTCALWINKGGKSQSHRFLSVSQMFPNLYSHKTFDKNLEIKKSLVSATMFCHLHQPFKKSLCEFKNSKISACTPSKVS